MKVNWLSLSDSEAFRSQLTGHEYSAVSHYVLSLAAQFRCSAYDCELVASAKDLRVS